MVISNVVLYVVYVYLIIEMYFEWKFKCIVVCNIYVYVCYVKLDFENFYLWYISDLLFECVF